MQWSTLGFRKKNMEDLEKVQSKVIKFIKKNSLRQPMSFTYLVNEHSLSIFLWPRHKDRQQNFLFRTKES
jgi:hypothetical protein